MLSFFFNACRENKRPEKRNTGKAVVSYLGRVQLSSVRAEEEGAEEHYLKQKWRQNPPVRSSLPPPPPAALPLRAGRAQRGSRNTRPRHRPAPAPVGKRPFFTKKIKEAERKRPQLFLLADSRRGARPKSLGGENSTHKGLSRAGARAARGGEGKVQGSPAVLTGAEEAPLPQPSCAVTGKGGQSCFSSGKRLRRQTRSLGTSPRGEPAGSELEELGCWAEQGTGPWGALSGERVPCPRPLPALGPGARAAAPPFSVRGRRCPSAARLGPAPLARPPEGPGPAGPHTHPTHTMPESSILPAAPARHKGGGGGGGEGGSPF